MLSSPLPQQAALSPQGVGVCAHMLLSTEAGSSSPSAAHNGNGNGGHTLNGNSAGNGVASAAPSFAHEARCSSRCVAVWLTRPPRLLGCSNPKGGQSH
ncbi:hypothetical protein HaLaN_12091 [Haematococcus lacustris]|uniref:Uncharacterized protein n=1 Tax=Haematococcus lacustris TaxID=44745 RepID=A0A699YZS3_HAELA|nr:hypothetical protein HaLaN_12091 [Haematococcus lacustris]